MKNQSQSKAVPYVATSKSVVRRILKVSFQDLAPLISRCHKTEFVTSQKVRVFVIASLRAGGRSEAIPGPDMACLNLVMKSQPGRSCTINSMFKSASRQGRLFHSSKIASSVTLLPSGQRPSGPAAQ